MPESTPEPNAADTGSDDVFFGGALSEAGRPDLLAADGVEGFDDELAQLRRRLQVALTETGDENLELVMRGVDTLSRVVMRRYKLPKASAADLAAAMRASLAAAGLPVTGRRRLERD